MKRWSIPQLLLSLLIGLAIWAAVAALCMCVGSTGPLFRWPAPDSYIYRRDPVILASFVGAALASAGVVYQAILRNPLADPYLLGVSSGASLAAFIWHLASFSAAATLLGAASQQLFAFAGAIIAVTVVLGLSGRRGRLEPVTLLLVGVIVNAINGSIFLLINELHADLASSLGGAMTFLIGGIQTNIDPQQRNIAAIVIAAGWLILLYLSGQLNVATLSEAEAQSLGVRIHRLRWIALIIASIVTAAAVAVSGPIGFVGLICPHLARLIVGPDQRRLLPLATALGASLLAAADAFTRILLRPEFAATRLEVGVITGLLGGPFFLLLLWQSRRRIDA